MRKNGLMFFPAHYRIKVKGGAGMPKKPDDSLKTEAGLYVSKIRASRKYDETVVDNIRVRVPKGWKEQMQEYVSSTGKYNSVNSMICELIKKEVGIDT